MTAAEANNLEARTWRSKQVVSLSARRESEFGYLNGLINAPSGIERKHNCNALIHIFMRDPAIEPERSTRNTNSESTSSSVSSAGRMEYITAMPPSAVGAEHMCDGLSSPT